MSQKNTSIEKILLLLFFMFIFTSFLYAQNRYALVIGNNNYRNNVNPLVTAVNDATDISNSLKKIGFDVDLKLNVTILELEDAIDKYLYKLNNNTNSEGFFWFAGHGVNVDNKHYLLPIDVNPSTNNSIVRGSYSVDTLIDRFDKIKNKANLIVLDACRNDFVPGQRSLGGRGLAVVPSDAVVGNQVIYSTMAGQTANDGKPGERNSPFAAAFLSNIETAISFDNLFIRIQNDTRNRTNGVQRPFRVGSFTIENYSLAPLNPAGQAVANTPQSIPPANVQTTENNPNVKNNEEALLTAIHDISNNVPKNLPILITGIVGTNEFNSQNIQSMIEYEMYNAGFQIVSEEHRQFTIDLLKKQANDTTLSDESYLPWGQLTGAKIIITGGVFGNGEHRRMMFHAVNVETWQILSQSCVLFRRTNTEFINKVEALSQRINNGLQNKIRADSAFVVFNRSGTNMNADFISDIIENNLINQSKYRIVARNDNITDLIKKEIQFQYEGHTSDDTTVSIGRALGGDYALFVEQINNNINVKIVDITQGNTILQEILR